MNRFIKDKDTIKISEILQNNYSLSPQQYKEVTIDPNYSKTIKSLLINDPYSGKEVGSEAYVKKSDYIYIRTKGFGKELYNLDLSINGAFDYIKPCGYTKNNSSQTKEAKKGDILFATGGDVGNVCYVADDLKNNIISSHIMRLNFGDLQYYCLAFLKTELVKDQVSMAPSGGIKGLDTFSKEYLLNARIPFPKNNADKIIKYVSFLSECNVKLEQGLFSKLSEINNIFESEIKGNQKPNEYNYFYPKISEINKVGRLDTLRYSPLHKEMTNLINNYTGGCKTLSQLGYRFERGQNLQISNIGLSIYSNTPKDKFYKLILSKDFTKYCTFNCDTYIGNKTKLSQLKKGDIVFSSRGDYGRVVIVLDELDKIITNIDNIVIRNSEPNVDKDISICLLLNWYRENGYIRTIGFVGSGADSLTQNQIDSIPIPIFSNEFMGIISNKYYSNYKIETINESSIIELISNGGIKDIENMRVTIRNLLETAIEKIVSGIDIDLNPNVVF